MQVDNKGNRHALFEAIVDHRTDRSEAKQHIRSLQALEPISDDARRRKNERFQLAEYAMKNADCHGRVWSRAGTESGCEAGQPMLVEKAICGLRRSGAAFTALLVTTLDVNT